MSIRGRIEEARVSQSGKSVGVKIGNTWYQSKDFSLQQMVGDSIQGNTSTSEFNGKTMHWLNDWSTVTPSADDAFQAAQAPRLGAVIRTNGPPAAAAAPQTNKDASIVAQALTKACTAPGDDPLKVWATYCTLYRKALGGVPDSQSQQSQPAPRTAPAEFDDSLDDLPF